MIPTAAPPLAGAALRLLRTAAGRRALQASLLVGGLLALGFLCGERAYASDGRTATVTSAPVASTPARAARPVLAGATRASAGRVTGNPAGLQESSPGDRKPQRPPEPARKPEQRRSSEQQQSSEQRGQPRPQPFWEPREPGTAAEPGKPSRAHPTAPAGTSRVRASADRTVSLVTGTVGGVGDVVRPVVDTVVRPATGLVETLTGGLTAALPEALPSLPSLPSLPAIPAIPVVPDGPPTPAAPSLPGPLTPPAAPPVTGDGGRVPSVPSARPVHPHRTDAVGAAAPDPVTSPTAGRERGTATALTYGPAGSTALRPAVIHQGHDRRDLRGPVAGPAPARQGPAGDASGALGDRSAVDGAGARHGDTYAVAPEHRVPPRLVPVTSEAATAGRTRDRYRDVPLFPA
ncbi:hypothetical protein [Streptomyces sp. NPDC007074]|uniref:hypothetical protein n=1 Tax=Streptomyces sp. NPDC007074 TaxID=3156764 RepID=UPI0033C6F804